MQLLHFLDSIDKQLFLFLNGLHSPFFDVLMWQFSSKLLWIPLYILIVWYIIKERKWNTLLTLLFIAIMIVISDQVCNLIKDLVLRYRPSHDPVISNLVHLVKDSHGNYYRGGDYGFVSSHAANTFALAIFVSMFFKLRWVSVSIFIWAALVSYSRIYLGVHYPLDVLGGAFVGICSGILMYYIDNFIYRKYLSVKGTKASN